jgi:hypothetical protein
MCQNDDIFGPSQLNYEAWRHLLRSKCGRYYSEGIEPAAFIGWVRPVSARAFTATDIGCNSRRVERTYRDVRLDGADHYFVVFLARGQLAMTHNDQSVRLAAGDVVFVDAARPVTYLVDNPGAVQHHISQLTAPVAGFSSWIRTAGWALPARRNARRAPTPQSHSRYRQRSRITLLASGFLHAIGGL